MHAQDENGGLSVECKVATEEKRIFCERPVFCYFVPIAESGNKLEQIEKQVEQTSKTRTFFANRFLHEMHPLPQTVGPVGDERHFRFGVHRQHRKVTARHFENFICVFHRAVESGLYSRLAVSIWRRIS